jgi:aryl-alcohol dehydrogenase-like predicted oxidoreductase
LRYRTLGRTGLQVSEIGFGAWGIGGDAGGAVAYGPADRGESLHALRSALDLGITFYDTSDFYGFGRSEELIGEAFSGRRNEVVVSSKGGMLADGKSHDFSPSHLRRSLEGSLRRLRSDYIDLYQLHSPAPDAYGEETVAVLRAMQQEGKIRALGLSARSPAEALDGARRFGFPSVQVNFNLLDQRAIECGLLEAAGREGIGIVVRTPLCFGFLTGRYAAGDSFHEHDHRSRWSSGQRERWADAPRLFESLFTGLPGQTPAQFALRYCLSHAAVSTAIPGMLTASHVQENSKAGEQPPLSAAEQEQVADIYAGREFFVKG